MFSVALCTYNGGAFVAEQLRSILDQTDPAAEVVVCDDGSTDGTLDAIDAVAKRHRGPTDIRIESTTRIGGVTANFDRAIGACRGDVIALSDQDDRWHPNRLAATRANLPADHGPRLVFANAALIDGDGAPLRGSLHENLRLSKRERASIRSGRAFEVLLRRNLVTGAATAFTRSLYDLATPFPESWVHDEWLAIIAAALGEVVLLDERLIDYRLHGGNQIGVADPGAASRLGRMLQPRGERYARLRRRSADLVERLESLAAPTDALAHARAKLDFETTRAAYPRSRLRRLGPVLRRLANGSYARYSSQRRLDAVRDILQPA